MLSNYDIIIIKKKTGNADGQPDDDVIIVPWIYDNRDKAKMNTVTQPL